MTHCLRHFEEALALTQKMLDFADLGLGQCGHDGCLLLDGIIRDDAYAIRAAVERYLRELREEETETGQIVDPSHLERGSNHK